MIARELLLRRRVDHIVVVCPPSVLLQWRDENGGAVRAAFAMVDRDYIARDLAARFEHRLFLSGTSHNGHSNSFSALLEILDSQRFVRGVDRRTRQPVLCER